MKTALITGVTGQDGAYLAELLLEKGYVVHGIKRRASLFNTSRIDHLYRDPHEEGVRFFLHHGDVTDSSNLSHVAMSFEEPEYTADANALGTLRVLEAMRILGLHNKTRFYQASTSTHSAMSASISPSTCARILPLSASPNPFRWSATPAGRCVNWAGGQA